MSLLFPYQTFALSRPAVSLPGRAQRPRPILGVTLIGPTGSRTFDALLDTGADDTVFPDWAAARVGLHLAGGAVATASGVGLQAAPLRYALVTLRIASMQERREWSAWVGFTPAKLRQPLLGFAGFLQFFTATFFGDREEVELAINSLYPGT